MGAAASSEASDGDLRSLMCDPLRRQLDAGLDPNSYVYGTSQLFRNCHFEDNVRLLLERGADPNMSCYADSEWYLLLSCYADAAIVLLLLDHGANPNVKCCETGRTTLHYALATGNIDISRTLIRYGADLNAKDHSGRTPADMAFLIPQEFLKEHRPAFRFQKDMRPHMRHMWMRRKWMLVKCSVKFLSLHQRAVVTANHPDRLRDLGVFEL
jgi:hypothetical protein